MKIELMVKLVWQKPLAELNGFRAESYCRFIDLPFVPSVGMRLVMSVDGLRAAGMMDSDAADLIVLRLTWYEADAKAEMPEYVTVEAEDLLMGVDEDFESGSRWIEAQGFKVMK